MHRRLARVKARTRAQGRALVFLTVLATPVAFTVESIARAMVMPPDFEEVRPYFEPYLTPMGWALVCLGAIGVLAGLVVQRRMAAQAIAKLPPEKRDDPDQRRSAAIGVFLLAASVPQLPSVLASICYTLGASIWPVAAAMVVSTIGVVLQAMRLE
jgi:hypothetical protein